MKLLFAAIFLMLGAPIAAQDTAQSIAAASRPPTVATFLDFPPYISDTEPDEGILSVIVKESFARAGIEPDYTLVPWRRSFRAVMRGEIQASYSWALSVERERDFHLSKPIFSISNQLLTTYGDVDSWQQLGAQRPDGSKPILCVPVGWKIAEEIVGLIEQDLLQRVSPGHPRFCLELTRAERTNILYMPRMTAIHYLNALQAEEGNSDNRPWPRLYGLEVPSGIANTQHVLFTQDDEGFALKQRFDQGFASLVASGRYREILNRFVGNYPEEERDAIFEEQINAGILPPE